MVVRDLIGEYISLGASDLPLKKKSDMARRAEKERTRDGLKLKIVNPNAAGIDIAYGEMQVCVPEDRDGENNRCFGSFTCDYEEIASWLKACNITTVAMESTGSYWVGLYFFLEERGFDVLLANARDVKNVSGKKTDEADAEWIMLMHSYGLLKPSFHPDASVRSIRELARHRDNMLRSASKEVQHMQKSLVMMNIKVDTVISDILGKSGRAIIEAILNGNHDPKSLALLADPRCKASRETIEKSLGGTWDSVHVFELRQSYELYKYIHTQIADCEAEMDRLLYRYTDGIGTDMSGYAPTNKRIAKKNAISFDAERHAFSMWGVNAMEIPGMSLGTLTVLMGELGSNFVEKFPSAKSFCKWCNLVPNNKISGGKLLSSKVPKQKNRVGQAFRHCANSVKSIKTGLGIYFRRQKSKGGHLQAIVATANKIARIFYTMVVSKIRFDENKVGLDEKTLILRKMLMAQRTLDRLNLRLSVAEE